MNRTIKKLSFIGVAIVTMGAASADIKQLTWASVFTKDGTTPVFVRFSTVIHSKGSPEFLCDPCGFATKFFTDEGNWDLVGNNLPVFFIRDAIKFPDMTAGRCAVSKFQQVGQD